MSPVRWGLSILIIYHLLALTAAAVPHPEALRPVSLVRHPSGDALASVLTPVFDRFATWVSSFEPVLYRILAPARVITRPYINAGLGGQQWNMFGTPYTNDRYVRLDYYVASDTESTHEYLLRELILPADHEERVRWLHQFRDKAILNTLENVDVGFERNAVSAETTDADTERVLRLFEPIVRYFSGRIGQSLPSGERVVRTELWVGAAPIPRRGEKLPEGTLEQRLEIVNAYHDVPARTSSVGVLNRRRGTREREADLVWSLEYFETF